jgi:hypothetical protein
VPRRAAQFHIAALQTAADFAHAAAELPAQQRSQSHAVRIADFGGDLVDDRSSAVCTPGTQTWQGQRARPHQYESISDTNVQ